MIGSVISGWPAPDIALAQPIPDRASLASSAMMKWTATVPYNALILNAIGLSSSLTMSV